MGVVKPRRAAEDHLSDLPHRYPRAILVGRLQQFPDIVAVEELHRHKIGAVGAPHIEHVDDVRMSKVGGRPGLIEKHGDEIAVHRPVGKNTLEDNELLEPP